MSFRLTGVLRVVDMGFAAEASELVGFLQDVVVVLVVVVGVRWVEDQDAAKAHLAHWHIMVQF